MLLLTLGLLAFPISTLESYLPTVHPVDLRSSDFRRFSVDPWAPPAPNATAWAVPAPADVRSDGRLAVNDAVTVGSFSVVGFSFTATFLSGRSGADRPSEFGDELVVFAASDVSTYHGSEFGIRSSLSDGNVYAYAQYPDPIGGVVFQEQPLFANDGRSHEYQLHLFGTAVTVSVDGVVAATLFSPGASVYAYHVVTTAHRASAGWDASGVGLLVANVVIFTP